MNIELGIRFLNSILIKHYIQHEIFSIVWFYRYLVLYVLSRAIKVGNILYFMSMAIIKELKFLEPSVAPGPFLIKKNHP